MDNIFLEISVHWSGVRFEVEVGVYEKFAKMLVIAHENHAKQ